MKIQFRVPIFLLCLELLNRTVGLRVSFPFVVHSSKVQVIAMQIIKIKLKLKIEKLCLPRFAENNFFTVAFFKIHYIRF